MVKKYSLRKIAKICHVDLTTAFHWQHKILDVPQRIQDRVKLSGIIEADETCFPTCLGRHKNFK
ncbi:hypothetical protein HHE03_13760 [Helicobacter heilmannii]|nr:hypothetical protein HHE03_13760 [Helicobacter heilmannii]